jgi:hypothetical protein
MSEAGIIGALAWTTSGTLLGDLRKPANTGLAVGRHAGPTSNSQFRTPRIASARSMTRAPSPRPVVAESSPAIARPALAGGGSRAMAGATMAQPRVNRYLRVRGGNSRHALRKGEMLLSFAHLIRIKPLRPFPGDLTVLFRPAQLIRIFAPSNGTCCAESCLPATSDVFIAANPQRRDDPSSPGPPEAPRPRQGLSKRSIVPRAAAQACARSLPSGRIRLLHRTRPPRARRRW